MHLLWRSKITYFFIALLLCTLLLIITWQPLSSFWLEWYFKNRLEKQLGGVLQIEEVHWKDGQLLLENPKLFAKESSLDLDRPKFYAKQIAFHYDFSLWQKKLLVKVFFIEPIFTLESTTEMLLKVALNAKIKKRNLLEWGLSIPEGKIIDSDHSTMPFSMEILNDNTQSKGWFSIDFTPPTQPEAKAFLNGKIFTEPGGEHTLQLTFSNVPLSKFAAGLKRLPGLLKDLEVTTGLVNGSAKILLPRKHSPDLDGTLVFSDLSFKHPQFLNGKVAKATFSRNLSLNPALMTLSLSEHSEFKFPDYQFTTHMTTLNMDDTQAFTLESNGDLSSDLENWPLSFQAKGKMSAYSTKNSFYIESQFKELKLESPDFLIESSSLAIGKNTKDEPIIAVSKHEFNYLNEGFKNELLMKRGNYLDKKSCLVVNEINGQIASENGNILAKNLSGYCCGLSFSADVQVMDYAPKSLDVEVMLNSLNGTIANVKDFLSHFLPQKSLKIDAIPLQGTLSLAQGPHKFLYKSDSNILQIQGPLKGSLSEGKLDYSTEDFSLQELACDFTYHPENKDLNFDHFQGTLFFGEAENAEEYGISGNVHFKDFDKEHANFNFRLENNDREYLQLSGKTELQDSPNTKGMLGIFVDNKNSRILESSPIECEVILDPSFRVDKFHMHFDLSFEQLASHLKGLTKTKLWKDLGISKDKISLLNQCKGSFHTDLNYTLNTSAFWLDFTGSNLQFGTHPIQNFFIRSKKQGNIWSVEQLQIDQLSIAADVVKENRKWLFPFLGIRWGTSFLMGIKGQYLPDKHAFTGNINLLEIDGFKKLVHEQQPLLFSFQADNAAFNQGQLLVSDQLGSLSCTGQWLIKDNPSTLPFFSYQGGITGHHASLFGFEFEYLQANCAYSDDTLLFNTIAFQDPSGFAQIDQIKIARDNKGFWKLSAQDINVTDWRPSLLRSSEKTPLLNNNSLIVNRLKMWDLQGIIGNSESFYGKGELQFSNKRQQRDMSNPFLAIPVELINRIGLDPAILTPASGTISFNVKDGKFFLTKFKDVYSEGRLSQFHLTNSPLPSYMDFDGNLNLNVRINQNNLLFKLTELSTFTITGSLDHPNYSMNKKSKKTMSLFRKLR